MSRLRLALGALILALASPLFAQHYSGVSTFGRDFYAPLIIPSGYCPNQKPFISYRLLVSAPYGAQVSISYISQFGREVNAGTISINAVGSAQLPLDLSFMTPKSNVGEVIEHCCIHVTSTRPVAAYIYTEGPRTGGLTRLLPVQLLDNQYVVATLPSNDGTGATTLCEASPASSLFAIAAVADSTWVYITPNGTTLTGRRGVSSGTNSNGTPQSDSVRLNRGEVYFVKSETANDGADEAGSIITSTKPIAVWGGHEAALNGLSSSTSHGLEQRNILFQQLVPKRYWRTKDYVSIPLKDSPGGSEGSELAGEKLRVFTWDYDNQLRIRVDSGAERTPTIDPYRFAEVENVIRGMNVTSQSNLPISPVLFDYRDQNTDEPFTAPTMMVLTPWQNRSRVHAFAVSDPRTGSQSRFYINVIAQTSAMTKIKYWKDGSGPKPITALPTIGPTFGLPGLTGLTGRRFEVTPGSYFFTCDSGFLVYAYGDIGLSPSSALTGYREDNSYTSFASPLAEAMGSGYAALPAISVTEACGAWTITARGKDSSSAANIELLSDPKGIFRLRTADSGYVSTNVDVTYPTSLILPGDSVSRFRIHVLYSEKPAEAYVQVINRAGYDTVIHLSYRPQQYTLDNNTFAFLLTPIHQTNCRRFTLFNRGTSALDTIRVQSARTSDLNFRVTPMRRLPLTLQKGDSLVFEYCYLSEKIYPQFFDTVSLELGCATAYVYGTGSGSYADIYATDWDFGKTHIGTVKTHSVNVTNTGSDTLTITGLRQIPLNPAFTFADSAKLPVKLAPRANIYLNFSYAPTEPGADTVRIEWISSAEHQAKSYSWLWGVGMKDDLKWDVPAYHFGTWNKTEARMWLMNPTSRETGDVALVDSVVIVGADAADFSIDSNQLGYVPLVKFQMYPQDTIWVRVGFAPDTTTNRSTRRASIVAYGQNGLRPSAELVGSIGIASVRQSTLPSAIDIVQEENAVLVRAPGEASAEVFDITGRRMLGPFAFRQSYELPTTSLIPGVYFVRVNAAGESSARMINIK